MDNDNCGAGQNDNPYENTSYENTYNVQSASAQNDMSTGPDGQYRQDMNPGCGQYQQNVNSGYGPNGGQYQQNVNSGYGPNGGQYQQGMNPGCGPYGGQYQQGMNPGYGPNGGQYQQYPNYGYQYQGGASNAGFNSGGSSTLAIVAMVCGILSIVLCCVFYLSIILAIAAVALGIVSVVKNMEGKGMAIAGIVTGVVGLLISLFMIYGLLS